MRRLLLIAVAALGLIGSPAAAQEPLTADEEARLADIVAGDDLRPDPDAKPSDD